MALALSQSLSLNSSGVLEAPMRFELSASGLAEDRDAQVNQLMLGLG